jgi:hypothetical protein
LFARSIFEKKKVKKAKSRQKEHFFFLRERAIHSSLTFRTHHIYTQNTLSKHHLFFFAFLKQQQKAREGGGGEMETQQLLLVGRRAFCGAPSFKRGTKGRQFFFFFLSSSSTKKLFF